MRTQRSKAVPKQFNAHSAVKPADKAMSEDSFFIADEDTRGFADVAVYRDLASRLHDEDFS